MRFPGPRSLVLNTSQSNASTGGGYVTIVTLGGTFWHSKRCRRLLGLECMALQVIWLPHEICNSRSQSFLQDLAGNAFCAGSCLLFIMVTTFVLAEFFVGTQHLSEPQRPLIDDESSPSGEDDLVRTCVSTAARHLSAICSVSSQLVANLNPMGHPLWVRP